MFDSWEHHEFINAKVMCAQLVYWKSFLLLPSSEEAFWLERDINICWCHCPGSVIKCHRVKNQKPVKALSHESVLFCLVWHSAGSQHLLILHNVPSPGLIWKKTGFLHIYIYGHVYLLDIEEVMLGRCELEWGWRRKPGRGKRVQQCWCLEIWSN